MADPRPLRRKELAKFLPDQRAIRAFEKLFDLIPPELEELFLLAQSSMLSIQSVRGEVTALKREIAALETEVALLRRRPNLDQLIKRIEVLETLEG